MANIDGEFVFFFFFLIFSFAYQSMVFVKNKKRFLCTVGYVSDDKKRPVTSPARWRSVPEKALVGRHSPFEPLFFVFLVFFYYFHFLYYLFFWFLNFFPLNFLNLLNFCCDFVVFRIFNKFLAGIVNCWPPTKNATFPQPVRTRACAKAWIPVTMSNIPIVQWQTTNSTWVVWCVCHGW